MWSKPGIRLETLSLRREQVTVKGSEGNIFVFHVCPIYPALKEIMQNTNFLKYNMY